MAFDELKSSITIYNHNQIVLPTGESSNVTFKETDTLWTVYTHVLDKAHLWGSRPFNLTKSLPKTVYTEDKFNMTLKEAGTMALMFEVGLMVGLMVGYCDDRLDSQRSVNCGAGVTESFQSCMMNG